jgi:transcription initiation factor TFIID subunit 10
MCLLSLYFKAIVMSNTQPTPPAFAYPLSSAYSTASAEVSQSNSQVGASSSTTQPAQQSRQAAEEARKDRTLAEFILMLDEYEPLVCMHMLCVMK